MKEIKQKLSKENGALIVEASIYFPIVLAIIFAILYVSLWKIEDCAVYFAAQKVANSAANAIAHQNYEKLYGNDEKGNAILVTADTSVDFDWADSEYVPKENVDSYYASEKNLYKRVKINTDDYEEAARALIEATKFVPFTLGEEDVQVEIKTGLLRTVVIVETTIGFQTPGIMKYIGFEEELKFKSKGYQFVTEPVEFVRNTDLAFDLVDYLFERLGISDKIDEFTSKWKTIRKKLGID